MTTKIGEFYGFYPTQQAHVYHVDLIPLSKGDELEVCVIKANGAIVLLHSVTATENTKVHLKMSYRPHDPEEI